MASQLAAQAIPAPGGPPAAPGAPPGAEAEAAPAPVPGAERATILWVDDNPDDNALELAKLRDDGLEVLVARSTAEAMDVLSLRRGVRAVVTDLGRSEDGEFRSHAGMALLRQLKEAEQDQPVLVYTSPERAGLDRRDALEAGATIVTASPTELFAALGRVLASHPDRRRRRRPTGWRQASAARAGRSVPAELRRRVSRWPGAGTAGRRRPATPRWSPPGPAPRPRAGCEGRRGPGRPACPR